MKKTLLFLFVILTSSVFGQAFNNSRNWSKNKHEIYLAIGSTHFLGDLGGLDREGTQKSPADLDWSSTRIGGGMGYRFRFHPSWATTTQLYFGMVHGDDANTDEIIRNSRNLSFRSPILELSQRLEFILYANETYGYIPGRGYGRKHKADVLYIFSGVSGFFFNPQTQINGKWTNLRPLRTEGQGLPDGPDEYGRLSVGIPLGVGFKFGIGELWRIGIEVSFNKTFTDYIDDVSTEYYDPAILESQVGPEAVYAANPSKKNQEWFTEGQQRGNPQDNDAYLYGNITITRNITSFRYRRPHRWGSRTKF